MPKIIPILDLSGSPHERGAAHGESCRGLIQEFAAGTLAVHQENNEHLSLSKDALTAVCGRSLGFLEKFSPDLVEEMRGIAAGADLPFADILFLNMFLELEDLRAPAVGARVMPDTLWGCTTFNISPEAMADRMACIGQTYDMEKFFEKFLTVLRIRQQDGPDMLLVTLAGILGLVGLNSAGIAAVINKIVAPDARPGVIYPFIMRTLLAAERIGDALGTVIFSPRATGMNYQLNGSGLAFCAETSAARFELLPFDPGFLAHTNHYVGQTMRGLETPNWLSHGGSMVRKRVADDVLGRNIGSLTPGLLKELTRDHTNHPRSICAHGFPGQGENTAFHTIFAVIMRPDDRALELCPGNPCENHYQTVGLDPAAA